MADNYLITGYWGEPHVTAENDRGINAAIFGSGRYVLPVGEQFRAEYIGNNTVRMYDGKLIDNGAAAGIPAGRYVDLVIAETGQGKWRNDLIVFRYEKNASTLIESGSFVVIKGTETNKTAEDPSITQNDLLSDSAALDEMALWRVKVSGATISAPVQIFDVWRNPKEIMDSVDKKAPIDHASTDATYGAATVFKYGHARSGIGTPKAPGKATAGSQTTVFSCEDHVHPEQVSAHGITTEGTGAAYTATVEGITELVAGASFIMLPHTASTTGSPTLNVNGLGAKAIRRGVLDNSITTVASTLPDWLGINKPVRVTYNGLYWVADLPKLNVSDIMNELVNLHVWKKYSKKPELKESWLTGTNYITWKDSCYVEYADAMRFENGVISLVNPVTLDNPSEDDLAVVKGKYIYSSHTGKYYLVSATATIVTNLVTLSSGGSFYAVSVNSMTEYAVSGTKEGLVASTVSDTYPTDGEHTDGYYYVYNNQLGD